MLYGMTLKHRNISSNERLTIYELLTVQERIIMLFKLQHGLADRDDSAILSPGDQRTWSEGQHTLPASSNHQRIQMLLLYQNDQ